MLKSLLIPLVEKITTTIYSQILLKKWFIYLLCIQYLPSKPLALTLLHMAHLGRAHLKVPTLPFAILSTNTWEVEAGGPMSALFTGHTI